ncbi:MAG: hypothetical protein CM15mP74_18820 [Halieaceae bacterium]|nr:MAG: hypothetical protein CM15mP74_18820 [Halieaceae bacterium]
MVSRAGAGCEAGGEGGISSSPNTGLVFVDKTLASDSYDAELEYNSAYLMYDHTFDSVWQVIVGGALRDLRADHQYLLSTGCSRCRAICNR